MAISIWSIKILNLIFERNLKFMGKREFPIKIKLNAEMTVVIMRAQQFCYQPVKPEPVWKIANASIEGSSGN